MSQTSASILSTVLLLGVGACASVEAEREQMSSAISTADRLGHEISRWRASLPPDVPASVTSSIEAFRERAGETRDTLEGLSNDATAGVDLTGLSQALAAVEEFDISEFGTASASARREILDQLDGLAESLQRTAERVRMAAG